MAPYNKTTAMFSLLLSLFASGIAVADAPSSPSSVTHFTATIVDGTCTVNIPNDQVWFGAYGVSEAFNQPVLKTLPINVQLNCEDMAPEVTPLLRVSGTVYPSSETKFFCDTCGLPGGAKGVAFLIRQGAQSDVDDNFYDVGQAIGGETPAVLTGITNGMSTWPFTAGLVRTPAVSEPSDVTPGTVRANLLFSFTYD
ncbi:fimbrial protein [Providencia rettgeri]|uniref:fimbrial protein n=1 Tax=Providencia rettgeri TaxID=587 RepID=UPI000197C03A|nr:fimbrial protein [Providencia rettgeri]QXA58852.1 type 1 fimbrial protein [Providencia rettgeri]